MKGIRPQDEADDAGNLDLDISYQAAKKLVPMDLYNHLSWMLHDVPFDVGPDGCVPPSQKQHEQVLNIGQDVIAGMSTIPTPKQVGTALHIMKQTRSKDTVTLLNRFGNGIGYHDAQRYISTMASRAEGQLQEKGYFIPENISQGFFTHFAIDNLDFHENTVDGKTTHGTTHIIYQYRPISDDSTHARSLPVPLNKSRKLSLSSNVPFVTKPSMLTLTDRQKSRSLSGMKLVPEAQSDECTCSAVRCNFCSMFAMLDRRICWISSMN